MRLQIVQATVQYGADVILDHINFEILGNEKIAVVGRNGCGKTTLLKLIAGSITMNDAEGKAKSSYILAGGQTIGYLEQINFEDLQITAEEEIKKVFQPIYDCRDRMRAIEERLQTETDEKLLHQYADCQKEWDALGGDSCERDMQIMFRKFGFAPEDIKKPMGEFSGGQQTKIAFIKLLLAKPDILLLDEPTNHLDLPSVEWLEEYLKKYEKAVVVVSHDRAFLDRVADVTYEIEYHIGKRYSGNYSAFLKQKEALLAKQEKDYEAQQKEIKRLTEWIEKWKNTPTKVSAARSKRMAIEHMVKIEKPRRFDKTTFHTHFSPRISSYSTVLTASHLSIGYDTQLSEVSFTLKRGERLAVIGENGKGKSTLLKTLHALVPSLGGTYRYGENVETGYYDQQTAVNRHLNPQTTLFDHFHNLYPRLTNEEVRGALGAFAFSGDSVEKQLGQLSGGERVRLALCEMFFKRPNFLILDEPTNHMDIYGKESLEEMLSAYEGTVLFVSHDRYFIKRIATQILAFEDGEVHLYPCSYEEYLLEKKKREEAVQEEQAGARQGAAKASAGNQKQQQTAKHLTETAGGAKDCSGAGISDEVRAAIMKNPGKERARIERKLKKLEEALEQNEAEYAGLSERYQDPAISADFEELGRIQAKMEELEQTQEELLEQMMEQEEELAIIESIVSGTT